MNTGAGATLQSTKAFQWRGLHLIDGDLLGEERKKQRQEAFLYGFDCSQSRQAFVDSLCNMWLALCCSCNQCSLRRGQSGLFDGSLWDTKWRTRRYHLWALSSQFLQCYSAKVCVFSIGFTTIDGIFVLHPAYLKDRNVSSVTLISWETTLMIWEALLGSTMVLKHKTLPQLEGSTGRLSTTPDLRTASRTVSWRLLRTVLFLAKLQSSMNSLHKRWEKGNFSKNKSRQWTWCHLWCLATPWTIVKWSQLAG